MKRKGIALWVLLLSLFLAGCSGAEPEENLHEVLGVTTNTEAIQKVLESEFNAPHDKVTHVISELNQKIEEPNRNTDDPIEGIEKELMALDSLLKERYAAYFTVEGFQEFATKEAFLYHVPNYDYHMSIGDIVVHPVEGEQNRFTISAEVAYTPKGEDTTFYQLGGTATMPVEGKISRIEMGDKDLLLTRLRADASKQHSLSN